MVQKLPTLFSQTAEKLPQISLVFFRPHSTFLQSFVQKHLRYRLYLHCHIPQTSRGRDIPLAFHDQMYTCALASFLFHLLDNCIPSILSSSLFPQSPSLHCSLYQHINIGSSTLKIPPLACKLLTYLFSSPHNQAVLKTIFEFKFLPVAFTPSASQQCICRYTAVHWLSSSPVWGFQFLSPMSPLEHGHCESHSPPCFWDTSLLTP